jgi:hypothetical protein
MPSLHRQHELRPRGWIDRVRFWIHFERIAVHIHKNLVYRHGCWFCPFSLLLYSLFLAVLARSWFCSQNTGHTLLQQLQLLCVVLQIRG